MDLLKPFKKVVSKLKEVKQEIKQDEENQKKLDKWQRKLTTALAEHNGFRADCAKWDAQYKGTPQIGKNVSYMSDRDAPTNTTDDARQVVRLTFQLIESQIDPAVPMPKVEAIEEMDQNDKKKMIEGMLTYMAEGPELERVVSENERITKKNSYSIMKVNYNPNAKAHKWLGKIETSNPHPINVIPQPGVYRVKDMDYLFHIENRTVDYVCRSYGEEFRDLLEDEGAEYNYLESFNTNTTANSNSSNVSLIECWYKDKDGDVCLMTWVNDVLLRDVPKFYYKRDEAGNILEKEQIDITEMVDIDGTGNMQPQVKTVEVTVNVLKQFPFVIHYNIPKEKSFYGISDVDVIWDQQEGIKKTLSIEEQKQLKGTTKIFYQDGMPEASIKKILDPLSDLVPLPDVNMVRPVDMKTPDGALKDLYGIYVQAAKDALGVTEASQGRADSASLSGRALELLANNAAGRLTVKMFEKQIAFTELYQLYYAFMLAYYDEPRPFRVQGKDNNPEYGYFDKSKLIKQDDAGDWYYPEFDIQITIDSGLPKDKRFILETANNNLRLDPIEYWMIMESIGFPNATAILDMEKQKKAQAEEQARIQSEILKQKQQEEEVKKLQEQQRQQQVEDIKLQQEQETHQVNMQKAMGGMTNGQEGSNQ